MLCTPTLEPLFCLFTTPFSAICNISWTRDARRATLRTDDSLEICSAVPLQQQAQPASGAQVLSVSGRRPYKKRHGVQIRGQPHGRSAEPNGLVGRRLSFFRRLDGGLEIGGAVPRPNSFRGEIDTRTWIGLTCRLWSLLLCEICHDLIWEVSCAHG